MKARRGTRPKPTESAVPEDEKPKSGGPRTWLPLVPLALLLLAGAWHYLQPQSTEAAVHQASELAARGAAEWKAGDHAAALNSFSRALKLAPDRPDYYRGRAQVYIDSGDPDLALADLDRAMEESDPSPSLIAIRGDALRVSQRWDAAAVAYQQAIEKGETSPKVYLGYGAVLGKLGRFTDAIAVINDAIGLTDQDADLFAARGVAHRGAGDLSEALEDFSLAIQLRPGATLFLQQRPQVLAESGDPEAAVRELTT
ncbi:MAG: tetratricopeptide repeat protein, partial [Planctomycetes bacterium]|nr:tetratricopeptide repeat protein [Planctomycetota bacterium]